MEYEGTYGEHARQSRDGKRFSWTLSIGACITASALTIVSAVARAADAPPPRKPLERPELSSNPNTAATRSRAPRTSDRCYTQYVDCILNDRKIVGASCWCVTPFGPSYGRVR